MLHWKKNTGRVLLIAMMFVLAMTSAGIADTGEEAPSPTKAPVQATISTPSGPLNMRKDPDNLSRLVTKIPNKKTVTVLGYEGDWAQVTYKQYTGYIKSIYLVEEGTAPKYDGLLYPGLLLTFIRAEESEDAPIIGQFFYNDYFKIVSQGKEWTKVKYGDNETGFVLTSDLRPEEGDETKDDPSRYAFVYAELNSDQQVRNGAFSSAEVIGSLKEGYVVEVYYAVGSWSNVSDGSLQGWVRTSALHIIEDEEPDEGGALADHTASYFTATTQDRIVQLYFNPTTATKDNHYITLKLGAQDKLMVFTRSYQAGDMVWAQVSDGEYVGWTPAGDLTVSDTMETYTYKQTLVSGSTGTAYAREDGVNVYDGYPGDGKVLSTLRKGEEITIQLTVSQDFVAMLRGGAYYGNVKKSDLIIGMMDAEKVIARENKDNPIARDVPRGTPAPQKSYEGMEKISKETAWNIGLAALDAKYDDFAGASAYTVLSSYHDNEPTQFEKPYWQFDFEAPRADHPDLTIIKFTVMVHAYTQNVIYITKGWEADLTEIDYSTPTPAPTYTDEEKANPLSESQALSIGQSALKNKYPDFDPSKYSVSIQYVETSSIREVPYWQIDFLDERKSAEYSVFVHAYTKKILYTCDPGSANG